MCKHNPNAQVSVRAPCCKKWFDCTQCHVEGSDHPLAKQWEITFGCKKCKKVFRKDMTDYEEQDEFCPHCDNHYAIPAMATNTQPTMAIIQSDDPNELKKYGELIEDGRVSRKELRY